MRKVYFILGVLIFASASVYGYLAGVGVTTNMDIIYMLSIKEDVPEKTKYPNKMQLNLDELGTFDLHRTDGYDRVRYAIHGQKVKVKTKYPFSGAVTTSYLTTDEFIKLFLNELKAKSKINIQKIAITECTVGEEMTY